MYASGSHQTEACIPEGARIALISTRRAQPAADALKDRLHSKYVLHDMLTSVTAPLHELSSAQLVLLEIPSVVVAGFEHTMLAFVHKLLALNVTVCAIVQPSLRRRNNRTPWVNKWNYLPHAPFKFSQTCSCKLGNNLGCHLTYYVGCSRPLSTQPCSHIPTLSASSDALVSCFGGTITYLTAQLLSHRNGTGHPFKVISGPVTAAPVLCRSGITSGLEPQQTPDSAQHTATSAEEHTANPAVGSHQTEHRRAYPTDSTKEKEKARRKAQK